MDLDNVYYTKKIDNKSSIDIDKVYFIYNDFDRVYHYDWSYYENLRRITNRTGEIITIDNDSINFKGIEFSSNRINLKFLFMEQMIHHFT